MSELSLERITKSLQNFKSRRDALLHEDIDELEYHLTRFVAFCESDVLAKAVLSPLLSSSTADSTTWWKKLFEEGSGRGLEAIEFPDEPDEEHALRFAIMQDVISDKRSILGFGSAVRIFNGQEANQRFLSLVIRPFCEEVSRRLEESAKITSLERRALQAVPLNRIPSEGEIKIFLSHRSADKPVVERYYRTLNELGFRPWMDEPEMPAGTNLERGLFQGLEESCAAVFS
jgi:hypothetical protein